MICTSEEVFMKEDGCLVCCSAFRRHVVGEEGCGVRRLLCCKEEGGG